jgi:hypothetical protein
MNRRDFTLMLGAAVVAGGMPAVAVELAKLPKPELAGILSGGLSVTFDYEDGVKVGPFPAAFTLHDVLTLTSNIEKSGTMVAVSLYMDDEHVVSADLTCKQSVVRGNNVVLSWPIRMGV